MKSELRKNVSSIQNNNTRFPSYCQYPRNPVTPGIFQAYRIKSLSDDAQDPFAVKESCSITAIPAQEIYFFEDLPHYGDVIMGAMASQITSLTIVYSTVYLRADPRKHQSSAPLAFVRGIHRWEMTSNAENVSILWSHHVHSVKTPVGLTSPPENTFSLSAVYGSTVTKCINYSRCNFKGIMLAHKSFPLYQYLSHNLNSGFNLPDFLNWF